ncbi:MAG: hypothetical protein M1595_00895 [Candidatus Thermoplasmatota archaeon]|nr:hypothetical protein [Candidatus Thermoplasmatota archaeon]
MSTIGAVIYQLLNEIASSVQVMFSNPFDMMKFTIPVAAVFVTSFAARRYAKKQKIDMLPSFEKKREMFSVPHDRLNLEVSRIMRENYSNVVTRIRSDFESANDKYRMYKKLLKRYRKYNSRIDSSIRRIRLRAINQRREILKQLIDLHDSLAEIKAKDLR